jgi:hypothetical protein
MSRLEAPVCTEILLGVLLRLYHVVDLTVCSLTSQDTIANYQAIPFIH